jgi:hypothetical protein
MPKNNISELLSVVSETMVFNHSPKKVDTKIVDDIGFAALLFLPVNPPMKKNSRLSEGSNDERK